MKAVGLVVVSGGVATVYEPAHVDVRVVDLDNLEGTGDKIILPPGVGFEELVNQAELGEYVKLERE